MYSSLLKASERVCEHISRWCTDSQRKSKHNQGRETEEKHSLQMARRILSVLKQTREQPRDRGLSVDCVEEQWVLGTSSRNN